MLEDSLSYPQRGGGWRTVLIGGLLGLFGFLVVPAVIVYGYSIRVLRSAALGEEAAPQFEDWGGLLVDGLKAAGIGFAYVIVPYVVLFVGLFGTSLAAGGEEAGAAVVVVLVLIALLAFVFLFVAAYVLPVALTNFALEDRIGAAFAFRTIANAAFTRDYVVAVLISMAVGFVVSFVFVIVFAIISIIFQFALFAALFGSGGDPNVAGDAPLIFGLIGSFVFFVLFGVVSFVGFYVQVVTYYLLGRGSGATLVDGSTIQSDTYPQ